MVLNRRPTQDIAPPEAATAGSAATHDERGYGRREVADAPGRRIPATLVVNVVLALGLVALMLAFIGQNDEEFRFSFLWMDFTSAIGLAMLLSALAGGVVAALVAVGLFAHTRRRPRRRRLRA